MEQPHIIIVLLILGLLLMLKEILRKDKRRLIWRIVASTFLIAGFYFLQFPPAFQQKVKIASHEIAILTPGAVLDSVPGGMRAYSSDSALVRNGRGKVSYLTDLSVVTLSGQQPRVHVFGCGLDEVQLRTLPAHTLVFHPSPLPEGAISANWAREVYSGNSLEIKGVYHNTGSKVITLSLAGTGAASDSVKIKPGAPARFALSVQPKLEGKAVYRLIARQGKDTLSNEPVPFQTRKKTPLRLFMLSAYPDFEFRFLKDWLYENNHSVITQTVISKSKQSNDYLNVDDKRPASVTRQFLNTIDVVILDEEARETLTPAERGALQQAVNGGLGMLVLSKSKRAVTLRGQGKETNSNDSVTYEWLLAGQRQRYEKHWHQKIQSVARKEKSPLSWGAVPRFPTVGRQMRVVTERRQGPLVPAIQIEGTRYAPRQNREVDFQWDVTEWPARTGWHQLQVDTASDSFYVYGAGDWASLRHYETWMANQKFREKQRTSGSTEKTDAFVMQPISLWWVFALIFACLGYLWYESQILCNNVNFRNK